MRTYFTREAWVNALTDYPVIAVGINNEHSESVIRQTDDGTKACAAVWMHKHNEGFVFEYAPTSNDNQIAIIPLSVNDVAHLMLALQAKIDYWKQQTESGRGDCRIAVTTYENLLKRLTPYSHLRTTPPNRRADDELVFLRKQAD